MGLEKSGFIDLDNEIDMVGASSRGGHITYGTLPESEESRQRFMDRLRQRRESLKKDSTQVTTSELALGVLGLGNGAYRLKDYANTVRGVAEAAFPEDEHYYCAAQFAGFYNLHQAAAGRVEAELVGVDQFADLFAGRALRLVLDAQKQDAVSNLREGYYSA